MKGTYFNWSLEESFIILEFISSEVNISKTGKTLTEINKILDDNNHAPLIIDLKNVSYIDSTALGMFNNLNRKLVKNGSRMCIVCDSKQILELFNYTDIVNVIRILNNIKEALEFLRGNTR
jgi:anti-sigma B factor antagonist